MGVGKGLVYQLTMVAGLGFVGLHTGGEIAYVKYYKKQRDEQALAVSCVIKLTVRRDIGES